MAQAMTNPAAPAFIDGANKLLAPCPATLDTGTIEAADGTKLAVLTIRTPSTTVTVMMAAADLATWVSLLEGLRDSVGAGKLQVVTALQAAQLGLNGHRR